MNYLQGVKKRKILFFAENKVILKKMIFNFFCDPNTVIVVLDGKDGFVTKLYHSLNSYVV